MPYRCCRFFLGIICKEVFYKNVLIEFLSQLELVYTKFKIVHLLGLGKNKTGKNERGEALPFCPHFLNFGSLLVPIRITNLGFGTGHTPASPELGCGIINALTPYIR